MSEASQSDQNQGQDTSPGADEKTPEAADLKSSAAADSPANDANAKAPPDDKAEIARLRDQLLRTAADFDNFRKRTRREVDEAQRRGRETTLKDLLPVFDDLELAAVYAETATDAKSLSEGIGKVLNKFQNTLERMGIKRVPALGLAFDPAVHEAIHQMPSADYPAGTVMAEVKPGYALGDYLLRAASVVVSKGPPPN